MSQVSYDSLDFINWDGPDANDLPLAPMAQSASGISLPDDAAVLAHMRERDAEADVVLADAAPAAPEGGDECCICMCDLERGETAVICPARVVNGRTVGLHTVCHGCMPQLYANMHNWMGGGKCPSCREDLIPLDQNHPYSDSLPPAERATVEAERAMADARYVARLVREQEREQADIRREQYERENPPPPRAPRGPARRKRTMTEYANDIANEQNAKRRAYLTAFRGHTQQRSRRNTRAWRRKKRCNEMGIAWNDDPTFIGLKRQADEWIAANPAPSIDDFNEAGVPIAAVVAYPISII